MGVIGELKAILREKELEYIKALKKNCRNDGKKDEVVKIKDQINTIRKNIQNITDNEDLIGRI